MTQQPLGGPYNGDVLYEKSGGNSLPKSLNCGLSQLTWAIGDLSANPIPVLATPRGISTYSSIVNLIIPGSSRNARSAQWNVCSLQWTGFTESGTCVLPRNVRRAENTRKVTTLDKFFLFSIFVSCRRCRFVFVKVWFCVYYCVFVEFVKKRSTLYRTANNSRSLDICLPKFPNVRRNPNYVRTWWKFVEMITTNSRISWVAKQYWLGHWRFLSHERSMSSVLPER